MRRSLPQILALALCLLAGPFLPALTTSSWTHTAEDDFDGEKDHVVAVGFGELRLSRATHALIESDPRFDLVFAVAAWPDGSQILATGPAGAVMRLADGKLTQLYKPAQDMLATALARDAHGNALIGYSGQSASVVRLDPATGKAQQIFQADQADLSAQFIWAIAPLEDGSLLLGTGPDGRLIQILPDGKPKLALKLHQQNILSLLPRTKDMLLVGTDPDGLVIRVNIATGQWFVLYDAPEPEITALSADQQGTIYAAASAAVETSVLEPAQTPHRGKLDLGPGIPLRREAPVNPLPPSLPDPSPGEPEPMPKSGVPVQRFSIEDLTPATSHLPTTQPSLPGEPPSPEKEASGNSAIYRIAANGFVTEIFRKPVIIHSMVLSGDSVLAGTGPGGQIFEIRPASDEVTIVAEPDAREVSAMALDRDGKLLLATSNPGGLLKMDSGYAPRGLYTSKPLDAGQPAMFGNLQLQGTLANNTALTIALRSGNVQDPENGGWSNWSEEIPAAEFAKVPAPSARFLQYRLTLTSKDPSATPVIEEIKLFYMLPNAAPRIKSIDITPLPPDGEHNPGSSPPAREITWDAQDANHDRLTYILYYRMGYRGQWVLLKDNLTDPKFDWNTRQLADGRYQIKVVASDQPSNPLGEALTASRYSDPVVVDNTPPAIGDAKSTVDQDSATVSLRVVDRTSIVASVQYALDSTGDWQGVLPSGMLYDSPDETVKFTVPKLAAGPHQLTIRASDSQGNTAYETLMLRVEVKK